jgi:steroid 5-alpha reductase family enzyme
MPDEAPSSKTTPSLPASVTHFGLNAVALALVLVAVVIIRLRHLGIQDGVLVLMVTAATPIVLLDVLVLRVHRRASTGIDWEKPFEPNIWRVVTKICGLAFTLGLIALTYWAFSEYHGTFYDPYYRLLRRFALSFAIGAPVYIWLLDGRLREPRDAYWQLGRVVLGHPSDARRWDIANHFRGWLVKAYFLPLMLVWLHGTANDVVRFDFAAAQWANLRAYDFSLSVIFGLDLLFSTAGYILSLRIVDTHIRSAEPTMFGWAVALFCYQPFYSLMERQYVHYEGDIAFGRWLEPWPAIRWAWAGTIIGLLTLYTLATIAFGMRFSNLTHRGILTNGPYRFSKHPAYISKNLSWWLISVPFVPHQGVTEAIRHSILLGCVNTIYFLRARTEEAHLSRDPTYVAYALWMNEHGALRFLGRWIPLLRYKPPAQAASIPTLG